MSVSSDDFMRIVINPLQGQFSRQFDSELIVIYSKILGKYSASVLEKAMSVFQETWDKTSPPQPAHLNKLCAAELPAKFKKSAKSKHPWELAAEKVGTFVDSELENFKRDALYKQAVELGCEYRLMRLVRGILSIQGQGIYSLDGCQYFGVDTDIGQLFDWYEDDEYHHFTRQQYSSAKSASRRVSFLDGDILTRIKKYLGMEGL